MYTITNTKIINVSIVEISTIKSLSELSNVLQIKIVNKTAIKININKSIINPPTNDISYLAYYKY